MRTDRERLVRVCWVAAFIASMYLFVAWGSFQLRNPKCNQMAFYVHFWDVATFQTLAQYQ